MAVDDGIGAEGGVLAPSVNAGQGVQAPVVPPVVQTAASNSRATTGVMFWLPLRLMPPER